MDRHSFPLSQPRAPIGLRSPRRRSSRTHMGLLISLLVLMVVAGCSVQGQLSEIPTPTATITPETTLTATPTKVDTIQLANGVRTEYATNQVTTTTLDKLPDANTMSWKDANGDTHAAIPLPTPNDPNAPTTATKGSIPGITNSTVTFEQSGGGIYDLPAGTTVAINYKADGTTPYLIEINLPNGLSYAASSAYSQFTIDANLLAKLGPMQHDTGSNQRTAILSSPTKAIDFNDTLVLAIPLHAANGVSQSNSTLEIAAANGQPIQVSSATP